jgi:hypothetical protein
MPTSRELVRQTLEFDAPARIPRDPWTLPWARIHYPEEVERLAQRFPNDLVTAPRTARVDSEIGTYSDARGLWDATEAGALNPSQSSAAKTPGSGTPPQAR